MTGVETEKKVCRYCGRMTSVHANFCWYCARELEARPERPMEETHSSFSSWLALGVIGVLVVLGIVLIVLAR